MTGPDDYSQQKDRLLEVNIFKPLYKFHPDVLELARQIPEIREILIEIHSRKIPIQPCVSLVSGGSAKFNFESQVVSISLSTLMKPLDTLGVLVHEFNHIESMTIPSHELYQSEEFFTEFMLAQEVDCFTKQCEFLDKYKMLSDEVSEYSLLMHEWKYGRLNDFVRNGEFEGGVTYKYLIALGFYQVVEVVRNQPNWVINNDVRISSCS